MQSSKARGSKGSRAVKAIVSALVVWCVVHASGVVAAEWNPAAFATENTLKLRTTGPTEGEYWFPVWLVVLDGQAYVRLGSRAAARVEQNTTAPIIGVEVAGQRFDRVRAVSAPEYADRVNKAIADKYWSDLFVHLLVHPLTLRLVPEQP